MNIMSIIINIDVVLAKRKMSVTELTEKVGITMANISILKNGKAKAIHLSTLEAICKALECQPGDVLDLFQKSFLYQETRLDMATFERGLLGYKT
jgi:putative transcriptional regulator